MPPINWLATIAAALAAFALGAIWYSPALFGKAWMADNKLDMQKIKNGNVTKIYGIALLLTLVMAINLAMFLADSPLQKTDVSWGTIAGFLAGIWVICAVAIHGLFEHKPARLIFINGGYSLAGLTLMGAIIGLWR